MTSPQVKAARIPAKDNADGSDPTEYMMPETEKRQPDPRPTIADQMAAQLAASDKAYRKRAAAAARLDALLTERAA